MADVIPLSSLQTTIMSGQKSIITVFKTTSKNLDPRSGVKPPHWVDNAGTSFRNPWESYRHHTFMNMISVSYSKEPFKSSLLAIPSNKFSPAKVYVQVPFHAGQGYNGDCEMPQRS